jgi:HK97 family phage major capsid protein
MLEKLREERLKHIAAARTIMDRAKKENRDLTDSEQSEVDKAFAESDRCKAEIEKLEKNEARSRRLAESEADMERSAGRRTNPADPGRSQERPRDAEAREDYSFELRRRGDREARTIVFRPGTAEHRRHTPDYREGFRAFLGCERRALQADLDTAGGYIVAPEQFVAELLMDIDDEVMIRGLSRTFTTTAQSIGVPRRTAKMNSFNWGSELSAPTKDTSLKFGKRSLHPHHMTGEILVSRDLLRSAVMSVEAIVRAEIARDAGELEEEGFITGNGAGQPLGLFTASSDGISTSRDVATGNAATAVTFDGLINAKFSLKAKYRKSAVWLFHRLTVGMIRKLKDGNGQYLWQPSTVAGEPDRILDVPVKDSEFIPNTYTSGQYVGIIGDMRNYWIVDSLDLGLQVLIEKYAEDNQVAYLARRKVDAAPTIEEAFARVKLG